MMEKSQSSVRVLEIAAGSLRFLAGQLRLMRAQGFEVHVVCAKPDDEVRQFCEAEGCGLSQVPVARAISPWKDFLSVVRLVREIRRLRPDLVESHQSKIGLVGTVAAWWAGVRVRIYVNHGTALSSAVGWRRRIIKWGESITCRAATAVRLTSRSIWTLFVTEGCCPEDKIRPLVPSVCGVDASERFNPARVAASPCQPVRGQFGIPDGSLVLGFVGRLMHEKGIETLHAAWQKLRQRYPTAHLLVVGSYDQRDPVPQAVRESMQRDPRVHLAGEVRDMPRYYAAMDVQILPSHREGLPVSLLEGSAMALPLVGSRVAGVIDVVEDGVTGTLVELHDIEGYVRAVGVYFDDSELRRRHGEAGRQRMLREFRPEDVWEANHRDYLKLLGRRESKSCALPARRSRAVPL